MRKYDIAVAAEAFGAALFAHAGYSVFVQYGANHPGYDILVSDGKSEIRVNTKGNREGVWILRSKLATKSYEECLEEWLHNNINYCFLFVQFQNVEIGEMPRCYLASAAEVANHMKTACFGSIDLSIYEKRVGKRGAYKGKETAIPKEWVFSRNRVEQVFKDTTRA